MLTIIKNIIKADAYTKAVIYPFAILAVVSGIAAVKTHWLFTITFVSILMCMCAYASRED